MTVTVIKNTSNTIQNGIFHTVTMKLDGTVTAQKYRFATSHDEEYGYKVGDRIDLQEYDWTGNTFDDIVDMASKSGHQQYEIIVEEQEAETLDSHSRKMAEKVSKLDGIQNLCFGDGSDADGYADYYGEYVPKEFDDMGKEDAELKVVVATTEENGEFTTTLKIELWASDGWTDEIDIVAETKELPFKRPTTKLLERAMKTMKEV